MTAAVVWTIIAGVGLLVGSLNLIEAYRDVRAAARTNGPKTGPRRQLASFHLRTEAVRILGQCVGLLIGIVALQEIPPAWFQQVATWGLVVIFAGIAFNSIQSFLVRLSIARALEEIDRQQRMGKGG